MSQLQIGLISLGALIILGVLLFNWWQERSIRRELYRRFDGPIDDVLMGELRAAGRKVDEDFRIDPGAVVDAREEVSVSVHVGETSGETMAHNEQSDAGHATSASPEPAGFTGPGQESVIEAVGVPEAIQPAESVSSQMVADEFAPASIRLSDPEPAVSQAVQLPPLVDPQVDEIAVLTLQQPCSGSEIRNALQPLPAFSKPVRWMGRDAQGDWHLMTREQEPVSFDSILCTLQLADRSGPASGEDLRNLHVKVEYLAERIGGRVEWIEHDDPLQYARELDQFCIDVDVMVTLRLIAGPTGPFAGTKLRGLAEASGLTFKEDGRFCFSNEAGEPLFTLACLDQRELTPEVLRTVLLRGVVLMMDVPRVAHGVEAFNQMVQLGRKLESALASRLMDENQQPLGEREIEKIRQQLRAIYSSMFARGIVPGGPTALRLFS